ncbi:MAG: phosphoribosylformylglycinamidine synthase subunit PurQ [Saprospiraceae bacterium]|nr:phosphoribosylformylglycinamidine synthase subunit PurQ [Saprospiraceae bacterium]
MKCGVITFPGSNCDDDMLYVMKEVIHCKVEKLWHKDTNLDHYNPGDILFVPGGFSYGDYLRCGAIARFSPIMNAVVKFAEKGGIVIGICNGFQILCEAGLLPGQLLVNESQKFICRNIYLKPYCKETPLTYDLDLNKPYMIPIAHADGRYFCDDSTLQELIKNNQIMFQYCDSKGVVSPESNVNGSVMNIAGICNATKNVCAMMPHPERASESELGNTDGKALFMSLFSWIKEHQLLLA